MKREEFLSKLGISLVTVCAGCCLASCGKGDTGTPTTTTITPPAGVNFAFDLSSDLRNIGDFKTNSGVIVVRIATGNTVSAFTAVQLACTHEGTSIGYSPTQGKFICPNHGSEFSNSGTVLTGPATKSLKAYTLAISGNSLVITG